MLQRIFSIKRYFFEYNFDMSPAKYTIIRTIIIIILSAILVVGLFEFVGIYYHNVWYQLFATFFVGSIIAPIFQYDTIKTTERLRNANAQVEKQAMTDYLTGLPNLLALSNQLNAACKAADATKDESSFGPSLHRPQWI